MVGYLLNVVYLAVVVAASPWLIYSAIRKGKYRQGFGEKMLGRVPCRSGDATCVWLHAVSVGEVKLLRPLVRQLAAERPDWELVISTTTRTGRALAREVFPDHLTFYCPLDFTWAVRGALRRVRPDILVLAELELWPNLIRLARRSGANVAVVNGRMSDNSFPGYRRIRPIIRRLLGHVQLIACQNEQYADRFRQLGADDETVSVTGSIKFDGIESDRENPITRSLVELAEFSPGDVVFTAGSTHVGEEDAALEAYVKLRRRHPELRLVLVPRHPERFSEVARMLRGSGVSWQKRSELQAKDEGHVLHETGGDSPRVLLVDTIGELSAWWGATDIAFVGGSLISHGGQNMIEPAALGAAICFGESTHNFRDVVSSLLRADGAVVVEDATALTKFIAKCLEDRHYAQTLGRRAADVVAAGRGATERTCDLVMELGEVLAGSHGSKWSTRRAA